MCDYSSNAEYISVWDLQRSIGLDSTSIRTFTMSSQQAQITTSAPGKLWGGRFTGERSSLQLPRITLLRLDRGPGSFNAEVQRLYLLRSSFL